VFRKAKVLLVNPWIHDFTAFDLWSKPVGLLSIGRLLSGAGIEVSMLDLTNSVPKRKSDGTGQYSHEIIPTPPVLDGILRHRRYKRYGIPYTEAAHRANSHRRPDLILLTSAMTYWYRGVAETVDFLKRAYGNVEIWAGGTYVELMPEHARENLDVSRIINNMSPSQVANEVFDFLMIKPGARWSDPDSIDIYHPYSSDHCFVTRTSFGCPMNCSYCGSHTIHGQYRQRNPESVALDILKATRRGVRNITFYDDALLAGNSCHLKNVLDCLETLLPPSLRPESASSKPLAFHVPNGLHGRLMDSECAAMLARWNFGTINIGYEFDDASHQDDTGGKIFRDELETAVANLRNAGFGPERIRAYLLCGYPGTKLADLTDAIKATVGAGARPAMALFSPVPGSRDFQRLFSDMKVAGEPLLANKNIYPIHSGFCTEDEYAALRIAIQILEKELISRGSVPDAPVMDILLRELEGVKKRWNPYPEAQNSNPVSGMD
jgi:radical SAM superfamily enzyme YgiQ (UPF0313 family)